MKLHYSQTLQVVLFNLLTVLLPYEITLFSNADVARMKKDFVLLPYEITLFSNPASILPDIEYVLLPYEITLFSNRLSAEADTP